MSKGVGILCKLTKRLYFDAYVVKKVTLKASTCLAVTLIFIPPISAINPAVTLERFVYALPVLAVIFVFRTSWVEEKRDKGLMNSKYC